MAGESKFHSTMEKVNLLIHNTPRGTSSKVNLH